MFFEDTQLPPIEDFYSKLSNSDISEDDYKHAQKVWETFNIKTLGEYQDLYCTTDVLLLADIFENFRDLSIKDYGLDPAHYFTLPGYAWDCMLKLTKVKLDLLTDYDMHMMIESGIRGGISMIAHRYAKANNKYLPDYDEAKENSYITHLEDIYFSSLFFDSEESSAENLYNYEYGLILRKYDSILSNIV